MNFKLVRKNVPPFGEIWFPKGGEGQMAHLGSEVGEYFELAGGIELRPGDVVFDVGANVGTFAMRAAAMTEGLHFVCVEPIPALFEALRHNFETHPLLKKAKHSLHRVGLTFPDDVPEAEFLFFSRLPCDSTRHVHEKRRAFEQFFAAAGNRARAWSERRMGRMLGGAVGGIVARVVGDLPKGKVGRWGSDRLAGATPIRCPLVTAEKILAETGVDRVALLKVDVEGAEFDVLRGFAKTTWPHVRQVVLEGHDHEGRLEAIAHLLVETAGFGVRVDVPEIARERGLDNFVLFAGRSSAAASAGRWRTRASGSER